MNNRYIPVKDAGQTEWLVVDTEQGHVKAHTASRPDAVLLCQALNALVAEPQCAEVAS